MKYLVYALSLSLITCGAYGQNYQPNHEQNQNEEILPLSESYVEGMSAEDRELWAILGLTNFSALATAGSITAGKRFSRQSESALQSVRMTEEEVTKLTGHLERVNTRIKDLEAIAGNNTTLGDIVTIGSSPRISSPLPYGLGYGQNHAIYYQEFITDPHFTSQLESINAQIQRQIDEVERLYSTAPTRTKLEAMRFLEAEVLSDLEKQYNRVVWKAGEKGAIQTRLSPGYASTLKGLSGDNLRLQLVWDEYRYRGFLSVDGRANVPSKAFVVHIRRELTPENIQNLIQGSLDEHRQIAATINASINNQKLRAARLQTKANRASLKAKVFKKAITPLGILTTVGIAGVGYFSLSSGEADLQELPEPTNGSSGVQIDTTSSSAVISKQTDKK